MSRVPAVVYCILTLCAVAALSGLWFVPPDTIGYDVCFSRRVLHLSCAGCGATRATYALLHGDFCEAFRLNALYVLMIPVLLYAWIAAGQSVFGARRPFPLFGRRSIPVILAVVVVFTVLRNVFHF